jgi:hypothetical protein
LENAEAMHRQALAIRLKVLGTKDPQVAQSMRRLGHVLWRRGSLDEAETLARSGVALQRELYGSTNLEVGDRWRTLRRYSIPEINPGRLNRSFAKP